MINSKFIKNLKYYLIKGILMILGIFFMIVAIWSLLSLLQITSQNNDLIKNIFDSSQICNQKDKNIISDKFCLDLQTVHWLIFVFIISFIFCFISFFPLFLMKNKKN